MLGEEFSSVMEEVGCGGTVECSFASFSFATTSDSAAGPSSSYQELKPRTMKERIAFKEKARTWNFLFFVFVEMRLVNFSTILFPKLLISVKALRRVRDLERVFT